jgi:hypothetical protein
MAQSKPRRDPPLKVHIRYAPPTPEADACWRRALQVLMEAKPKEDSTPQEDLLDDAK